MNLSEADLRRIVGFVAGIFEIRHFNEFVCQVITSMSALIPVDVVTYDEMNVSEARAAHWCTPRAVGTEDRRLAFQRIIRDREDPQLDYYSRTRDFRPLRVLDFFTPAQLRRTRFYNEILRGDRFEDFLTIPFSETAGTISGLALARDREFTERESEIVAILKPQLRRAAQNAKTATSLMHGACLAADLADSLGRGLIVLAADGRLKSLNRCAEAFLSEYFAAHSRERLPEVLDRWVRQHSLLPRTQRSFAQPSAPLQVGGNGKQAMIRLLPCGEEAILLIDEDHPDPDPRSLEALGISPREAQVLALVAAGKTNSEAAIILSISRKTVEKHLEHVYAKLAVETRAGAIALALKTSDNRHRMSSDPVGLDEDILATWNVARYLPQVPSF